jgi:FAD/FMN-containing dehydrogenase
MPGNIRTVCLEFFGNDLKKAVSTIIDIIDLAENNDGILLSGLEHLDERYVKAVGYTTKAARAELPRMILLIDISSDDEELLARVSSNIVELARERDAEGFIASSAEARHSFWLDRSRTAAIAAHTNAFKINEDVVIPLPRLNSLLFMQLKIICPQLQQKILTALILAIAKKVMPSSKQSFLQQKATWL